MSRQRVPAVLMPLFRRLSAWLIGRAGRREPDFVIGGLERPYLRRWFLLPRNAVFNLYLHQFLRSDDDRALHDHPWANCSVLLRGAYIEHTIEVGGIERRALRQAGDWYLRWTGRMAHRVELLTVSAFVSTQPDNATPLSCWTLFITGPRYREWGFHCPRRGWVHWRAFTAPGDTGSIGKGCDQ